MTSIAFLLFIVSAIIVKHLFFWHPMDVSHLYRDGPLMMGHRGSPRVAPENTILSFQRALDAGLGAVEVDVLCTKDGEVVCSHNHDLERETDGSGYINESDFSELRGINAGIKFPNLGVTPIPTLAELISALPPNSIFNIEIKSIKLLDLHAVQKVVALIRKHKLQGRVMISSFNPLVIGRVKMIDHTIPTAYLWSDENVPSILTKPRFINVVHPDILHPTAHLMNENVISFAKRKRLRLNVWTVNNLPAMDWLMALGVDGLISDFPTLMLETSGKMPSASA
jgi:glycerophosphoryl diester phosphodiesterase